MQPLPPGARPLFVNEIEVPLLVSASEEKLAVGASCSFLTRDSWATWSGSPAVCAYYRHIKEFEADPPRSSEDRWAQWAGSPVVCAYYRDKDIPCEVYAACGDGDSVGEDQAVEPNTTSAGLTPRSSGSSSPPEAPKSDGEVMTDLKARFVAMCASATRAELECLASEVEGTHCQTRTKR